MTRREEKGNQGNMLMIEGRKNVVLTARDLILIASLLWNNNINGSTNPAFIL